MGTCSTSARTAGATAYASRQNATNVQTPAAITYREASRYQPETPTADAAANQSAIRMYTDFREIFTAALTFGRQLLMHGGEIDVVPRFGDLSLA